MASTSSSTVSHTLPSLYRLLLRSSRETFHNDARMMAAWRNYVREKMPAAAASSTAGGAASQTAKLSDEFVKEWTDVARVLRENVAQGVRKEGSDEVYRESDGGARCERRRKRIYSRLSSRAELRITKDTELGDNDSIKKGRKSQLADLAASKGILRCGGGNANASPSGSGSTSSRRAFHTSRPTTSSSSSSAQRPNLPLPHPAPRFPSITVLADGSSISMTSTSPRSLSRLTKDPTNHPLWNPKMLERGLGAAAAEGEGGEEAGRMERFRRRFGGAGAAAGGAAVGSGVGPASAGATRAATATAAASEAAEAADDSASVQWQKDEAPRRSATARSARSAPGGKTAPPAAAGGQPRKRSSMFDMEDLDWMSGGRQARAGSPLRKETTGKRK